MTLREQFTVWDVQRRWCAENDGLPTGPSPDDWQQSDDEAVELLRAAMESVVEPITDLTADLDNDDRAKMVYPFVIAFRRAYYHHLGPNGEPDEPLGAVVADMIGNLCHLADRVEDDTCDPDFMTGSIAWHRGWDYYTDELEEARGHQEGEEGDRETAEEGQPVSGALRNA